MSVLKCKATRKIYCEVCGQKLKRTKTFSMDAKESNIDEIKKTLTSKANSWKLSEKQKHCNLCWSIVKEEKNEETKNPKRI